MSSLGTHQNTIRSPIAYTNRRLPHETSHLLIVLGLGEEKRGVEAVQPHQVIVRSLLDDLAPVDDKDPVGHFYGRQPVAD